MTPSEVVIRPVRAEDAEALAALVRALGEFGSVTREVSEVTETRVKDHLGVITTSDRHTLLVAEGAGQLVGYCSVHWLPMMSQLEGFVSELFVGAAQRGAGIGTRLIEEIKKEARARGCRRLHLENFRSKASYERGYYAKHGWQERPAAASFILDLRE
jgi:GNAT superfamily N-acetyltransferase